MFDAALMMLDKKFDLPRPIGTLRGYPLTRKCLRDINNPIKRPDGRRNRVLQQCWAGTVDISSKIAADKFTPTIK
jgi:hypothetical protein